MTINKFMKCCFLLVNFLNICKFPACRNIVVCELEDLRKEILLVEARLKLADETKVEVKFTFVMLLLLGSHKIV